MKSPRQQAAPKSRQERSAAVERAAMKRKHEREQNATAIMSLPSDLAFAPTHLLKDGTLVAPWIEDGKPVAGWWADEAGNLHDAPRAKPIKAAEPNAVWTLGGVRYDVEVIGRGRKERTARLLDGQEVPVEQLVPVLPRLPKKFKISLPKLPESPFNTVPVANALGALMRRAAQSGSLPMMPEVLPKATKKGPSTNSTGVRMNKKQKAVLIAVAAGVVAMLIYPPFHAMLPSGIVRGLGYSLIFNPPQFPIGSAELDGTVDIGLLIAQWLGVLIVGGITLILFKD